MSAITRRIGRFLLVFAVAIAALVPLWGVVAPTYTAAVSTLARPAFRLAESPDVTVLAAQGNELWVYRQVGAQEIAPFTFYDRFAFFAILPLIALLLATPGLRWSRRVGVVLIAVAAQLVLHTALVVASIELAYASMGLLPVGSGASAFDVVQILVRLLWEASPVVLWIALTFGAWKRLWMDARTCEPARAGTSERIAHAGTKVQTGHLREGRTT